MQESQSLACKGDANANIRREGKMTQKKRKTKGFVLCISPIQKHPEVNLIISIEK